MKNTWIIFIVLALAGCAHESRITPSSGHIDGQTTASSTGIPKPITSNVFVLPPKPKVKEQTYSVVVNEVSVKEILFALARESKLNIDIHPDIKGVVTMNAVDQTLPSILDRISKQVDLTYKLENNVLSIRPDTPVLKTYAINYVNMNRDTVGDVSVSNQIASSNAVGGSSAAGSNTSSTSVKSISENHFWDSLIQNIQDILRESDKEVLIRRLSTDSTLRDSYNVNGSVNARGAGSASTSGVGSGNSNSGNQVVNGNVNSDAATGSGNQTVDAATLANREASKENNAKEYRQLYAAFVIPNKETGVLNVRATQRQHEKVQEFLDKVQASAKRQVLIEASIVEIKLNDRYQAGVDWSRLGSGGLLNGFTFQQNLLGNSLTSAPAVAIGYNKAGTALGDLAASVRLLQTFGTTKVLSSPKLMVLNSQTAILKAVDNLVYFTVRADTTAATASSPAITTFTTTPQTIPVGIWMSVTPQINENGTVTLNVRPTISRQFGPGVLDPNPSLRIESRIPQITVREMESMLQVPSGNTVILGGLMQDEISNNTNGVPRLANIPIIGNAFKARDNNVTKTELVIFLRPTVIPNATLESDELKLYKQFLPAPQLQQPVDESAN